MRYREVTAKDRVCKTFKDDCVIRSIALTSGRPYADVFGELMGYGSLIGAYPNHDKVWITYLEDKGWKRNKPPRDHQGKLIRLCDWNGPQTAVVRSSGHLTAIVNGEVCDTWDCTYRPVNTYWTPPGK